jgi:glycosyltransferase involved in cell wall biosynthesis
MSPAIMGNMEEPRSMLSSPDVAILLCTFNGDRFLAEQLESIAGQQNVQARLYVSDDDSRDDTLRILEAYQARWSGGCMFVTHGPQDGYVANFFSLICSAQIDADYFAYSDQDDIWEPDKMSRAISALSQLPIGIPAVYCSRSRFINELGSPIGLSPLFRKKPGFSNALVQNIGGGNTMVFNRAARKLLQKAGTVNVVSHDWWTYLLLAGAGGEVIYDPKPGVRYRQHGDNQIGSNISWRERLQRVGLVLQNRNREWNTKHIEALLQSSDLLTEDSRRVLDQFSRARKARLAPRGLGIWRSGLHAQTFLGNLGLMAATVLRKL